MAQYGRISSLALSTAWAGLEPRQWMEKKWRDEGERLEQQLKNACGIQKGKFKIKGWPINSYDARAARTRQTLLWSRACCAGAVEKQRSRDRTIASVTPECYSSIPKRRINLEDSAALPIDSPLPY